MKDNQEPQSGTLEMILNRCSSTTLIALPFTIIAHSIYKQELTDTLWTMNAYVFAAAIGIKYSYKAFNYLNQ